MPEIISLAKLAAKIKPNQIQYGVNLEEKVAGVATFSDLLMPNEIDQHAAMLVRDGNAYTFAELRDQGRRMAAIALWDQQRIATRADASLREAVHRVACCLPVSGLLCASLVGGIAAGSLVMFVDPESTSDRMGQILADFDPHMILTCTEYVAGLSGVDLPKDVRIVDLEQRQEGCSVLAEIEPAGSLPELDRRHPALVTYTSGSTGAPKGVVLSHGNLSRRIKGQDRCLLFRRYDSVMVLGSWSHAILCDILIMFRCGLCLHALSEADTRFPLKVAGYIERHRINYVSAPFSYYARMMKLGKLQDRNLTSLRVLEFWGEAVPTRDVQRLLTLVPSARVFVLYDCAEAISTCYAILDASNIDLRHPTIPVKPFDGSDCRLVTGETIDQETGSLWVCSDSVMLGYWNRIADRRPGETGDSPRCYAMDDLIQRVGQDCYLVQGRMDGIVKIGGFRVSLAEVERALLQDESVLDALATAVADRSGGERIAAMVAGQIESVDEKRLIKSCRKQLPSYAVPARIAIRQVLPKTDSGKLKRNQIKQMLRREFEFMSNTVHRDDEEENNGERS